MRRLSLRAMALVFLGSTFTTVTVAAVPAAGAGPVVRPTAPSGQVPDATPVRDRKHRHDSDDDDDDGDRPRRSERAHRSDEARRSEEARRGEEPRRDDKQPPKDDQPRRRERRHCDEGDGSGVVCVDPIVSICVNCLLNNIVL